MIAVNNRLDRWVLALIAILLVTTVLQSISYASAIEKIESQNSFDFEDPTPGRYETSEYMIGSVAVGVIFPESNGAIDESTEDWTEAEEQQITNKINDALDWWASQNTDANVTFVTEFHYRVSTSYELINHDYADQGILNAYDEIMTYLGFPGTDLPTQIRNFINDLRERFNTDWAFGMIIVDASNDADGRYANGYGAGASLGGTLLQVPVKTNNYLDWTVAHEMGHIFWATDEYNGKTDYSGYLNVPDIEGSGCLMASVVNSWCLSGKPDGLEGTWGQVGWRDSDDDGILDIVDTFPRVYLNPPEIFQGRVNYTGITAVTPYPNNNPYTKNPEGKRNVTINKIKNIEFRVDSGDWIPVTITSSYKQAIENFTFITEELDVGEHFIEVKATNQWGNSGFANETVIIPEVIHDIAIIDLFPQKTVVCQGYCMNITVTVENQGDVTETFDLSLYANETEIETKQITLSNGNSTVIIFTWNTSGFEKYKNYTISAYANPVEGETDIDDNEFVDCIVMVTILGDINGDKKVEMKDIGTSAKAFGSYPGHERWNSIADINNDKKVDMKDIGIVAKEFGKTVQLAIEDFFTSVN